MAEVEFVTPGCDRAIGIEEADHARSGHGHEKCDQAAQQEAEGKGPVHHPLHHVGGVVLDHGDALARRAEALLLDGPGGHQYQCARRLDLRDDGGGGLVHGGIVGLGGEDDGRLLLVQIQGHVFHVGGAGQKGVDRVQEGLDAFVEKRPPQFPGR